MVEPIRDPEALQSQINEFQNIQQQLQLISMQIQQLKLQIEEIKLAEEELSKANKSVFRSVGPLLIETTKEEAKENLKNAKETFELRIKYLSKQEEKLRPKYEELRASLEKALKK